MALAALSAGQAGAVGLIRARALTRPLAEICPVEPAPHTGPTEERAELWQKAILIELSDFLDSRLRLAFCPRDHGERMAATAIYGAFTLLVWQPDCTAPELAERLNLWREEYRALKHSDFVAGIAAAPEAAADLLNLIAFADEALTEALSMRQIVCFSPAPSVAPVCQSSRQPRLLIVDDNRDQVEIIELIMQQQGYETVRAYSGAQALEIISRHSPDLLLLDVGMPQLDGFDVMNRLRDLNGGKLDIPVIMLTGSDAEESVRRGFELGARDYVIKPCEPQDLVSRVQSILLAGLRQ
ncbi:MAG TPA: response regulator [Blastocatellia bacterium]|nr:response regulator [Blastocatellia bacterium]